MTDKEKELVALELMEKICKMLHEKCQQLNFDGNTEAEMFVNIGMLFASTNIISVAEIFNLTQQHCFDKFMKLTRNLLPELN